MKRQLGLSLISTLVGLFLALLSSVTVLSLFKSVTRNSVSEKNNATQDSLVSSVFMSAQLDIQKAGFGIEASGTANNCSGSTSSSASGKANADFVLLENATLDTSSDEHTKLKGTQLTIDNTGKTGNAIVWHWNENSASMCEALIAYPYDSTASSITSSRVVRLGPIACTGKDASNWNTINWNTYDLSPANRLGGGQLTFTDVKQESCVPFGKGTASAGLSLMLRASNSTQTLSSNQYVCLPNLCR